MLTRACAWEWNAEHVHTRVWMMDLLRALLSVEILFLCPTALLATTTTAATCHVIAVGDSLSLQEALELTQTQNVNCTLVEVPQGEHIISSQVLFSTELRSIQLWGEEGEGVRVSCNYSVNTNYTWYFDHLDSVVLYNLHFFNCPRPLRLDTIVEVEIINCSFRYFSEAALDVYNCHHTVFADTALEHNRGTGIVQISYRGNTGGVSFGYNTLPSNFSTPSLKVSNSTFRNNSATAETVQLSSDQALDGQFFTGRGGALAVFSNESRYDLDVVIVDCIFENNYAQAFGGGLYLLLGGVTTHHTALVQRTCMHSNFARLGGGGVIIVYFNIGPLLATFVDCEIINNVGTAGGGIDVASPTAGDGNRFRAINCTFAGNRGYAAGQKDYGAALSLSLFAVFSQRFTFPSHEVTNCTFEGNSGANGIISAGYTQMNFTGRNIFLHNSGTCLRVVGALVHLSGELQFISNTGGEESALHLLSFAQLVLNRGLNITFEGNSGRFGASILVDTRATASSGFSRLAFNPQCPFLYEMKDVLPQDWSEVVIRFDKNTAVLGAAVYTSQLETCSWVSRSSPFFNDTHIVDWPIWDISETNVNSGYEDNTDPSLSVQTTVKKLVITNNTVKAWPGNRFFIEVEGLDGFNHTTTADARFFFQPFNDSVVDIPLVRFVPEIVVIGTESTTGLLTRGFTVYYGTGLSSSELHANFHGRPLGVVSVQAAIETLPVQSASFTLEATACPGGYVLRSHVSQTDLSVCTCNENIFEILLCEDDQDTVLIQQGKWAVFLPSAEEVNLEFYACPAGYCRCRRNTSFGNDTCVYSYINTDPDLQCISGRRGVLCGECRGEGDGVSTLLDRCTSCKESSGLLILALIIVDTIVFTILTLLDYPLPSWLYPFIFYTQVAPFIGLYFPDSFIDVGKYLYFVGSATGFYFVYDFCLYSGMTSQVAYVLRLLPLLVATVTCTATLTIRWCVVKNKFLKLKTLKHHGMWCIVILMYSHIVYSSMAILNCPSIADSDGTKSARWFVNGEVQCFTGGHIPLALLAILVLLAAVLLPVCVLLSAVPLRKEIVCFKWLQTPLAASYRVGCLWWAVAELGRRFFLILLIVALPRNRIVPVLLLALYTAMSGYVQPFKSKITNVIETAVNINFLVLLLLNATPFFHDNLFLKFPSNVSSLSEPGQYAGGDSNSEEAVTIYTEKVLTSILGVFYYLPLFVLLVSTLWFGAVYARGVFKAKTQRWSFAAGKLKSSHAEGSSDYFEAATDYVQLGDHEEWSMSLVTDGDSDGEGFVAINRRT